MRPFASASVSLNIWLVRSELADTSMYARRHQMNAADEGVDVAAKEFTVSCCKRWGVSASDLLVWQPHPGHRAFRVISKQSLASSWINVPNRSDSTVMTIKQRIAKEFKNKDGTALRIESATHSHYRSILTF